MNALQSGKDKALQEALDNAANRMERLKDMEAVQLSKQTEFEQVALLFSYCLECSFQSCVGNI
jgi:hypothetical protein